METLNLASKWQGEIPNTDVHLECNTRRMKYTSIAEHIPKHFSWETQFSLASSYKIIEYPLKECKKISLSVLKSIEQSLNMLLIGEMNKENTL